MAPGSPQPLVLVVVVIPSWWRQRGKTGVALGAILMRRVPPGALVRLVLPAVLTRPVAPLLARATVVPASATTSSSSAVAPVAALRASTEASIVNGPELLTIVGVVVVHVVEGAERSAALGDSGWSLPRLVSGSAASTMAPLRFTSLALAFFSSGSAVGSSRRERHPSSSLAHLFTMLNNS